MKPDSKIGTPQRVDPLAPSSVLFALFKHMFDEHGLTLLESEMTEIVRIVNSTLEARLEWWMRRAEVLALERVDLLKTLREIRDPRPSMEWQAKIIDAAIERNSPTTAEEDGQGRCAVAPGSACLFCANERQLKPSCTKQRWKVCKDHFMVTCPQCGHEGFWMENMKSGSYFACFSLNCNWRSPTPPNKVI